MLKGQRCFIIGSGNSLKGFDYSRLDGEFSIVLNHQIALYPNASAVLFIDSVFRNEKWEELQAFQGMIFCATRTQYRMYDSRENIIPFDLVQSKTFVKINHFYQESISF